MKYVLVILISLLFVGCEDFVDLSSHDGDTYYVDREGKVVRLSGSSDENDIIDGTSNQDQEGLGLSQTELKDLYEKQQVEAK